MALDPGIILQANSQGPDPNTLVGLYDFAQTIKKNREAEASQNALKAVYADPSNIDENGMPTGNALRQISQVDPNLGIKLYGDVAAAKDKALERDAAEGDLIQKKSQHYADTVLIPSQEAYQATLDETGNKDAAIKAGQAAMQQGRDQVAKDGWHSAEELDKHDTTFDPVKVDSQLSQFKDWRDQRKETAAEKTRAEEEARKERADADRLALEDKQLAEREAHDRATEDVANRRVNVTVSTASAAPPLDDAAIDYAADMYREKGQLPPLGMGKAAAGLRAQIIERAAQKAGAEGGSAAGDVAGQADVKANTAGLLNLGKMRASVAQAEGNASKEADLVLSKLDKGGLPGGPSALGKWVQGTRTGVFNDPDASAFQTAVESLKNEYVKVLSTQGGMSGGMSSDAARREADAYINPRLSKDQIKANIAVMRQSMKNRTSAIEDAYAQTRDRLSSGGKPAVAPAADGWKIERVN